MCLSDSDISERRWMDGKRVSINRDMRIPQVVKSTARRRLTRRHLARHRHLSSRTCTMNAAFSDELPLGGVAYQLALIVVVPWLVRAVVSRWNTGAAPVPGSSSSNPSSTKPPFTLPRVSWRHPTSLVLALAACYYLAQIVWAVPASTHNFFDEIGATYDAPNYILRNHFRYYTTARWYEDARGFKEPVPGLRAPSLHTDRLREAMSAVPAGDTRSDVPNSAEDVSRQDWLTALFELLKSAENRRIYLSYGEDAFLRCLWCRDTGDYAIYAVGVGSCCGCNECWLFSSLTFSLFKHHTAHFHIVCYSRSYLTTLFLHSSCTWAHRT